MSRLLLCIVPLLLVACAGEDADVLTPPPSAPLTPTATPPPHTPPTPEPVPRPDDDRCTVGFTSDDANTAFAVLGEVSAGSCTFDAVRVRGNAMRLVWTRPDDSSHGLDLFPRSCGTGTVVGAYAITPDGDLEGTCPGVQAAVVAVLEAGDFPEPSPMAATEQAGPDGEGQGGPPRPDDLPPGTPTALDQPGPSSAGDLPPKVPAGVEPASSKP